MSENATLGGGPGRSLRGDVPSEAGEANLRARIDKDLCVAWSNQPLWDLLFSERFEHPRDWLGQDTVPMFEFHGAKDSLDALEKALSTGKAQTTSQRIALHDGRLATSKGVWTPYFDCHRIGGRVAGVDVLTRITPFTVSFLDMSEGYWSAMEILAAETREYERLTRPALSLVR